MNVHKVEHKHISAAQMSEATVSNAPVPLEVKMTLCLCYGIYTYLKTFYHLFSPIFLF